MTFACPRGSNIQAAPSWCCRPCPGAHTPLARKCYINKALSCVDFRTWSVCVPAPDWKQPQQPGRGLFTRLEPSDLRTDIQLPGEALKASGSGTCHPSHHTPGPSTSSSRICLCLSCFLSQLCPSLPSSPGQLQLTLQSQHKVAFSQKPSFMLPKGGGPPAACYLL